MWLVFTLEICRLFYQTFEISQWCALAYVNFHPFFLGRSLDPLNLEMFSSALGNALELVLWLFLSSTFFILYFWNASIQILDLIDSKIYIISSFLFFKIFVILLCSTLWEISPTLFSNPTVESFIFTIIFLIFKSFLFFDVLKITFYFCFLEEISSLISQVC